MSKSKLAGRLILLFSVLAVASGLGTTLYLFHHARQEAASPHFAVNSAPLPSAVSYVGVFRRGAPNTITPFDRFARVTGVHPNLAVYYSGWGESFDARYAEALYQRHATVLIQIQPFGVSLDSIVSGQRDRYLRTYARQVRNYGHRVVISFAGEANGPWYPWGWHKARAASYVLAWRHVVTVFRKSGARNVTWLWDMSHERPTVAPIASYWPGGKYVTWVGLDGYYFTSRDSFGRMFHRSLRDIRTLTSKPVLLGEVAAGSMAGQAVKIANIFTGIDRNHLLGLVWFDVCQHRGIYHQCWQLEGHQAAIGAFRAGVASLTP